MKDLKLKQATEEEIRVFELKKEILQRLSGRDREFYYICANCDIKLKSKEEAMCHLVETRHKIHEIASLTKREGRKTLPFCSAIKVTCRGKLGMRR